MPSAITISATFLTGRYHGEEWPPSPARLFQALVAGVKTGGYRARWETVEPALRWLESRPAPTILARPAAWTSAYRLAVPNNDFDSVARAWAAGRPANPADLRTMKTVSPRAMAAPDPHVRYVWPLADGEAGGILQALEPLTECLYSFGWGIDMAYARLETGWPATDGYEEWVPSATGEQLKAPVPGFLADLEATYERFRVRASTMDTDTRPTVYRLQRYEVRGAAGFRNVVFALGKLDASGAFHVGWQAGMEVAAWLRYAAAETLRQERMGIDVDSFVLGHTEGQDDRSHRLSFAPLPSIGHAHADGRIRRVMIVEPPSGDGRVAQRLGVRLRGTVLTRDGGAQVCTVENDDGLQVTPFYTRCAARRWRTVTPVILHGFNANRGRVSLSKTEALLRRAFEMAGFSPAGIARLAFQSAPLWPGTGAAAQVRVPAHLQNYPRYHVEAVFGKPVTGPVLAGIGRHYGIGVFAAPRD